MSASNAAENSLLLMVFNNTAFANVGDAVGLRGSTTAGVLYVALHTADPGEAGDQTTSEAAYTGYTRVAVTRDTGGWTVTANSVSPTAAITFPVGTGGSGTVTHFSVGVAASGASVALFTGTVISNIVTGSGVTPELSTATAITAD